MNMAVSGRLKAQAYRIVATEKSGARQAVMLAAGGVSALGFAPLNWVVCTFAAFAFLIWRTAKATTLRHAFGQGWWFGVGHFTIGLNWIAGSFRYQDAMPVWLGWVAVVGVSFYVAVYPALACAGAWWLGKPSSQNNEREGLLPIILFFAACWIVSEWLRATLFTGFAWNPLGVAAVNFSGLATAVGSYGLSGLCLLLAGGALLAWQRRFVAGALLAVPLLFSALLSFAILPDLGDAPQRKIVVVQPNIGQQDKYRDDYDAVNFTKHAMLSGTPGAEPRLVLWPEAAIPYRIDESPAARTRLSALIGPKDILVTGADKYFTEKRTVGVAEEEHIKAAANSAFALDGAGQVLWRYDKAHLVPYGEYLALRWLLEPLGATRLVPGSVDFLPGPGPRTMDVRGFGKMGLQICYEIIFSGQVVDRNNRPDFIFNPSNDAWFGSWGPPQQLAQARLRAVEEGLPVIRSTPTGISAVISADGDVLESLPLGQAGRIETSIPLANEPTLFAAHGNILSLALAFFLGLLGVALGRRSG